MKVIAQLFFLSILSYSYGDPNLALDTIESRPGFIGTDYYYQNKKLKTSNDFCGIFLQSLNPKVMKYYSKWNKMTGVEFLPAFGLLGLGIYFTFSTSSNSNTKVEFKDIWYIPVCSIALISIGIPSNIIKQHYKNKSIEEFNTKEF